MSAGVLKGIIFATLLGGFFNLNKPAHAEILPIKPPHMVLDETTTLSESAVTALSETLKAHQEATEEQVAIAVLTDLRQRKIEDISAELMKSWRLGDERKHNGVLIVIATHENQIHIEVGYGLDSVLPNERARSIANETMLPLLKQDARHAGLATALRAGVLEIFKALESPLLLDGRAEKTLSGIMAAEPSASGRGFFISLFGWCALFSILLFFRFQDEVHYSKTGVTTRHAWHVLLWRIIHFFWKRPLKRVATTEVSHTGAGGIYGRWP